MRLTQTHINKYLAHIMDRSGNINKLELEKSKKASKPFELSGWSSLPFFVLRLNTYLRIYAENKLNKRNTKIPSIITNEKEAREIYDRMRLSKALRNEILLSLETLRCMRDGILVEGILNDPQVPSTVKTRIKKSYINNI